MADCPLSPESAQVQKEAGPLYARLTVGKKRSLREKAMAFLDLLEREEGGPGVSQARRVEVLRDIERHRYYEHTADELLWGCRFAWRHSIRCVGRFFWRQLEVRDERHVKSEGEVAASCFEHLRLATNAGAIQPLVTVFPARKNVASVPWRIWNYQLVRYAGYRAEDGEILGDPAEAEFTAWCESNGWLPPKDKGRFDVLPLVISGPRVPPSIVTIPRERILEVNLEHPDFHWFKELKLRWYAAPIVSNMLLEIGGLQYPAAPFNGWYMGTEIGARNLADFSRYDMLPDIAERMGILEKKEACLWRDRALVELNRAVLHSYKAAGVRIVDHHTAAQLHVRFEHDEQRLGRPVTGLWDWLVPPMSGAATPLWNRVYDATEYSPNFLYQDVPWKSER